MSKQLLQWLANGEAPFGKNRRLAGHPSPSSRLLHRWIRDHPEEPRIAWYPSAGCDFKDLLYLHPAYRDINRAESPEPAAPNLFLHTDVIGTSYWEPPFAEPTLYEDEMTSITVRECESLPTLRLARHNNLVHFNSRLTNSAYFAIVEVDSHRLGKFECALLYVLAENAAFCSEVLYRQKSRITHVVKTYWGGTLVKPTWLEAQLSRLGVESYTTHGYDPDPDNSATQVYQLFPRLQANAPDRTAWRFLRRIEWRECGTLEMFAVNSP